MNRRHNIPIQQGCFAITIADILLLVQSQLSATELRIEQRFSPFFGVPDNPVACVSLRWEECDDTPSPCGEVIYNPGSLWMMYRAGEEYYATISCRCGMQGVLRANAAWDDLMLTEQRTGATWQSLLNFGAGELLLRTKILLTDGLVFHASAIDDNGRGIVIVGHSSAGKSTQASFWNQVPGALVINEDRIAVRSSKRCAMCYGMPWGSKANITLNHSAPLSALILLEQAPQNDIKRLSPSVAAPLLLACAFLPYWDRALMQRAMTNLNKLLECVPVYLLRCRPEPAVVSLVRTVL